MLSDVITPEAVVAAYNERVRDRGPEMSLLREIRDLYGGDMVVPLKDFDIEERPAIVNLTRSGVDQKAMRIASVFPEIQVFPTSKSKQSLRRSRERRLAWYNIHEQNKTRRKLRRRARHMVGYASSPVVWAPDFESGMPRATVRDPLSTYACPTGDPDVMVPPDCIFATRQTMGWLKQTHPDAFARMFDHVRDELDMPIDVVEYYDPDVFWLIAARRENSTVETYGILSVDSFTPLAMMPNRVGRTPVVIPGEISMKTERMSAFKNIIPMYEAAAEFEALSRYAMRKGILQEEWLIGYQGDEPELVQAADPADGIPGIVKGGTLENRSVDPQFATRVAVGDLERAQRLSAGLHPELGGEAATNVRTGRRGDQLLSAVLDFPVQEAHELFEESLEVENEIAALIDLEYFGSKQKFCMVNFGGAKGQLEYTPSDLWRRNDAARTPAIKSKVSYYMAGLDMNDRIVSIGQRIGMGVMSADTAMRKDPLIEDPDAEKAKLQAEELRRAFMAQMQMLASSPESGLATQDLAKLIEKVSEGTPIEEAWASVEADAIKRAQEQQAQQQQQAGPAGPAGIEGVAPEVPGQIGEAPAGVGELNGLLLGLRGQAMTGPQG